LLFATSCLKIEKKHTKAKSHVYFSPHIFFKLPQHQVPHRQNYQAKRHKWFKHTVGHFTFWFSLLLKPKTETKLLNFGLSWS